MAKVTEQDVILFLKNRVETLKAELDKAQAALDAFSYIEKQTPADTAGVTAPKATRTRKAGPGKIVKALNVPETFAPGQKLEEKIAYILSQNGSLFNTEIIEKLQLLEPDKDPGKISKAVMVKLSALFKAQRLKAVKEGRKFRYEL